MNGENESIGIKITSFLFLRYPFLNFFERVSQVSLIEFRNISKFDIPFFDHFCIPYRLSSIIIFKRVNKLITRTRFYRYQYQSLDKSRILITLSSLLFFATNIYFLIEKIDAFFGIILTNVQSKSTRLRRRFRCALKLKVGFNSKDSMQRSGRNCTFINNASINLQVSQSNQQRKPWQPLGKCTSKTERHGISHVYFPQPGVISSCCRFIFQHGFSF